MILTLGDRPLTLKDVRTALSGPIKVELTAKARAAVIRSAGTVGELIRKGAPIYGVNTGFGKLAKQRIAEADLSQLQINIVRSHAAGVGEPLAPEIVRLVLLLKIAALAKGASGITPATLDTLIALLDADVLPVIPARVRSGPRAISLRLPI